MTVLALVCAPRIAWPWTFFRIGALLLITSLRDTPVRLFYCHYIFFQSFFEVPVILSFLQLTSDMAPSASEAASKAAAVVAGTSSSAKEFKKESTAARVLGAGMLNQPPVEAIANRQQVLRVSQS